MSTFAFLDEDGTVSTILSFDSDDIDKKWVSENYDISTNNLIEFETQNGVPKFKKDNLLKYNGTEFYYEQIPLPELTETELIQAEILLNQADILAKQNEQDEVLAAILLNQMEV